MNWLKSFGFGILLTLMVCLQSCRDDCDDPSNPDCENYDPCYVKKATSAYFIIEEKLGDYWIECDTIYGVGNVSAVRFTALQNADSFNWTMGSETINQKSFIRNGFPSDKFIPVSLIVINKHPNKDCFPKDDGRDTFSRLIYTWPKESYYDQANEKYIIDHPMPIQGKYRGYYASNPTKEVDVIIYDTSIRCRENVNKAAHAVNIPFNYFAPTKDDKNCGYFGNGWSKLPTAALIGLRVYRTGEYDNFEGDSILEVHGLIKLERDLKHVSMSIEYYQLWDYKKSKLKKDKFYGIKIE